MSEIWKTFEVFGCRYAISTFGRIKNVETDHIYSNKNRKGDYIRRVLGPGYNKGLAITVLLHRLVYEMFVGPIPEGFQVHHIDGNKQNNRLDNLMVVSVKEHAIISVMENPSKVNGMNYYNRYVRPQKIAQYDKEGVLLAVYANAKDASDATGVCQRNILQVANKTPYHKDGRYRKQAGGFIWRIAA